MAFVELVLIMLANEKYKQKLTGIGKDCDFGVGLYLL